MMFRKTVPLLLSLPLLAVAAGNPLLREGNDAMASGLWEVAASRYETALKAPGVAAADKSMLTLKLAEARIRGDHAAEGLTTLDALPASPAVTFWRAQALAALGRFREAVDLLTPALTDARFPNRREALFTRSSLQLALGDADGALASLSPLPATPAARLREAAILLDRGQIKEARAKLPDLKKLSPAEAVEARFLDARLLLAEGKSTAAIEQFVLLLDQPESQTLQRYHAAAIGLADAQAAEGNTLGATDTLLAFAQKHPDSPLLDAIFQRLLGLLPEHPAPNDTILERLAQWSPATPLPAVGLSAADGVLGAWPPPPPAKAASPLAPYALWVRAIGLHRQETAAARGEARRLLQRLQLEFADHPLLPRAVLQIGRWELEAGHFERAWVALEAISQSSLAPELRAEANFAIARQEFLDGRAAAAAKHFDEVAKVIHGAAADVAAINAGIARMQAGGDVPGVGAGNDERVRGDLELERALNFSAQDAKAARPLLVRFIAQFPQHPRIAEARLAAAETALALTPPDHSDARAQLAAIEALPERSVRKARVDYVHIRAADAADDATDAIKRCRAFLAEYRDDALVPEVTFLLGRTLFRNGDYHDARLALERLSNAATPLGQAAGLIAARAAALGATAQSREESLVLFDKVWASGGNLAPVARLEKARLLIDLSRLEEAAALLRPWLRGMKQDDPMRLPAGLLLGEALFARGSSQPDALAEALASYDQLLPATKTQPGLFYRIQYLRGMTLELLPRADNPALMRTSEALDAYYSVFEAARNQAPDEWEWFERSGFRALGLLEKAERWEPAIAVATKIASFKGPRAAEAAARAKQLRLEHMIWEESDNSQR